MVLKISGKNVDIGQALRTRIDATVTDAVKKYFSGGYSGHITVTKGGRGFETECALHLDSGMIFEARGAAGDAHASFDQAAERLEKRLRRYKRRLKDHKKGGSAADGFPMMPDDASTFVLAAPHEDEEIAEDYSPVIVAETKTPILTLSVSAAVMELDRTEVPVVVFRNSSHGKVNVVFRRPDGHFGWIDPVLNEGAGSGDI
jgi:ribosomal subunit interface protein